MKLKIYVNDDVIWNEPFKSRLKSEVLTLMILIDKSAAAAQNCYKQLLDKDFVISGIIKVEVCDNANRDLDYFGYHKNRIS